MPPCPLFTRCGGCAAQHMADSTYRDWKRGLVTTALDRAGLAAAVAPLVDAHGSGRRRAVFHVRTIDGSIAAGFMAARSHGLVAVAHCPVLVPALARSASIAEALARLLKAGATPLDVQVTATLAGLDVDLRGLGRAKRSDPPDAGGSRRPASIWRGCRCMATSWWSTAARHR